MVLKAFWASLGLVLGALGGFLRLLGSSLGPLDRPKRASRFVLELSWASFARFLLPKMALGRFWGRLWLVLGAPKCVLGGVLASDKPISTIKTALPSFDTLFFLVVVVAAAAVVVVVVAVVVSLLPCNFSSIRLGGMRGAIE